MDRGPFWRIDDFERRIVPQTSAEREREGLYAWVEEFDGKCVVRDGALLPDELIEPLFGDGAVSARVRIDATRIARRLAVNRHAKAHGFAARGRSEHQMQITRMKAEDD